MALPTRKKKKKPVYHEEISWLATHQLSIYRESDDRTVSSGQAVYLLNVGIFYSVLIVSYMFTGKLPW